MMPRSGGHYNYLGAAFGRVWAFLFGWMEAFIDTAGSGAAGAIVFVIFFNDLIGGSLSPTVSQLIAVAVLLVVMAVNLTTVHANGAVATFITALKVLMVFGIGAAAFLFSDGSWANFAASGASGTCEGIPASSMLGTAGAGAGWTGAGAAGAGGGGGVAGWAGSGATCAGAAAGGVSGAAAGGWGVSGAGAV